MLHDSPLLPFLPGEYRIRLGTESWELAAYRQLRRDIFCVEQGLFPDNDADEIDRTAFPIVALSCVAAEPHQVVGVVRIHEAEPRLWWGSRLGVHRDFRRIGRLGAELIRLAVCTAAARGCDSFLAHVQAQNVPIFRRLHWHSLREVELHGRPHQLMQADLAHYPPHGLSATRLLRPVSGLPALRAA